MEVNRDDDDDADALFLSLFEQLEGLSLSEPAFADKTDPWNINDLLQPLPSQFHQKQAPSSAAVGGVLEHLDQLMGPEYHHPDTVYTQDQSVQFGSNKPIIAVDPTQQLFSSNLNQCYITETSTNISPTLHTKRSQSQALFTVPPESIHFTPVASSVDDTCPADSNQQQQRGKDKGGDQFGYDQLKKLRGF